MEVRFVILAPSKSKKSYTVRLPLVVGRGDEVKFRIQQDSVSRRHCAFALEGDAVTVTDLGSTNGTFVGGQRLAAHTATPVSSGAEVRIGTAVLRVEYVAPAVAAVAAVAPHDQDTVPLSGLSAPDLEPAADLPELEPVAEAIPELEPVADAAPELEPAPAADPAGPPEAPAFPETVAAQPPAGEIMLPDVAPPAGPGDFAALDGTAPAPADGSFDFLASTSAPPPAADDKLDDFFKSLS